MSRDDKNGVIALACFLAALAVLTFQSGCGANARQTALRGAYAAVNAANAGFSVWDRAHQKEIVETATSLDEAKRRLNEYRYRRAMIDASIIAAYELIGAAALDKEIGMAAVVSAVTAVQRAIESIRGRGP